MDRAVVPGMGMGVRRYDAIIGCEVQWALNYRQGSRRVFGGAVLM